MKKFKLPATTDTAKVKVYALFGQPQKYENVDGQSVPPLPSHAIDTYFGTDQGINLNKFAYNVHNITYDPNISINWGSQGYDGTYNPDLAVLATPEYEYSAMTPMNYNRSADPRYQLHPGGQHQFGLGTNGLGYQTAFPTWQPYDLGNNLGVQSHVAMPVDPIGAMQGQGGAMSPDWHAQQTAGVGVLGNVFYGPKDDYETWRGGGLRSSIPAHNASWTSANNGPSKSYPDTTEDLQNYSKSLTKVLVVETEGELLNGYGECKRYNLAGACEEWAYYGGPVKKRKLCAKPKGVWSEEIGFGPDPEESSVVHTYEGEEGYIPIQPAYAANQWITAEKCNPIPISTNPLVIQQFILMGCNDDIVQMSYIDAQGNQSTFQVAYASWQDTNSEARKRATSLGDFDEECIILCDAEGNEKEGVILFREEDCSDDIEVTPTTPTRPPPSESETWQCQTFTGGGQQNEQCVSSLMAQLPGLTSHSTLAACEASCGGGDGDDVWVCSDPTLGLACGANGSSTSGCECMSFGNIAPDGWPSWSSEADCVSSGCAPEGEAGGVCCLGGQGCSTGMTKSQCEAGSMSYTWIPHTSRTDGRVDCTGWQVFCAYGEGGAGGGGAGGGGAGGGGAGGGGAGGGGAGGGGACASCENWLYSGYPDEESCRDEHCMMQLDLTCCAASMGGAANASGSW